MPKHYEDDDDATAYSLALAPPVDVSGAKACTARLSPKKRAAVKTYVNALGPRLREQHGKRAYYTPEQVHHAVVVGGFDAVFSCWAYSLYCSPSDFARIHEAAGEVCATTPRCARRSGARSSAAIPTS